MLIFIGKVKIYVRLKIKKGNHMNDFPVTIVFYLSD